MLEMPGFENVKNNFNKKSLTFLFSGLIIGAVAVFLTLNAGNVSGEQAAQDLVSTLEQSSGQDLELINVQESNGLYQVRIQDSNNQLATYYITKDGQMVSQETGMTNLPEFKQQVSAQVNFSECLEQEVVMYGNQSQQATAAQIQLLGGPNMVSGFYSDVNNEEVLQQAVDAGITNVPGFVNDESTVQGVQSIQQLEEFSGCEYNG